MFTRYFSEEMKVTLFVKDGLKGDCKRQSGYKEAKWHGLLKGTKILRHYGSKTFRVRGEKAAKQLSSQAAKRADRCMDAKKHRGIVRFVEKRFGEVCQNRCVTLNLIQGLSMFIQSISIDRCRIKFGMTVSCAKRTVKNLFPYSPIHLFTSKKAAFTLAEVLITLGIIGVVVALTLPSVINNARNKQLEAGFKKGYSILEQFLQTASYEEGQIINHINYPWKSSNALLKNYLGSADVKTFIWRKEEYDDDGNQIGFDFADYKTYNKKANIEGRLMDDAQAVLKNGMAIFVEDANALLFTIDINGIKKGPNRWGYDLFTFQVANSGKLLPMGAVGTAYSKETYCSLTSTSKFNGIACTYYAATDKNYFKNLPR